MTIPSFAQALVSRLSCMDSVRSAAPDPARQRFEQTAAPPEAHQQSAQVLFPGVISIRCNAVTGCSSAGWQLPLLGAFVEPHRKSGAANASCVPARLPHILLRGACHSAFVSVIATVLHG